jgi:hypothetical protein
MPERRVENVPLARVYDALDAEAYRTFRVAMRRSRGGVVRVDDLVAALAEIAPQSMETVFGLASDAIAALMRPPTTEPDLVPMANEPALRTLLTDAYRRAIGHARASAGGARTDAATPGRARETSQCERGHRCAQSPAWAR